MNSSEPYKDHIRPSNLNWPGWPSPTSEEIQAVADVLGSCQVNYWTGRECAGFEQEFASATGCRYGVALMNGSVALEGALKACGMGPGDEVIVTPRSFVASASSVVMVGARPVFADIDRDTQNLTATGIEAAITGKTKAVVVVHLAGQPCEMDEIMDLAGRRGLKVIEDCAQAHGASYRGRPVGSLGDCAAWSFCQDKIMTTGGEGGMITTDDPEIWKRAWSAKDHGRDHDTVFAQDHPVGFRWYIHDFGSNWRMTEMQAAIGRVQLRNLERWSDLRARNSSILAARFSRLAALRVPAPPAHVRHAWYKFYAFVRPEMLAPGWDRDRILVEISARGVNVSVGVCPEIYREKAFVKAGLSPRTPLPMARELGKTSLMFEVHPTLEPQHMNRIADIVEEVLARATAK